MLKINEFDFSLIIACYNEEEHLKGSFYKIDLVLKETRWRYEYIFVDDSSRDGTRKIIKDIISENPEIQIRYIFHETNLGRGQTVADGLKISSGKVIGFLDIDLEIPSHYIVPAVTYIKIGFADFITAHRIYKYGCSINSFIRYVISRCYNFLVRHLLCLPYRDTEAGFKFFNRDKILPVLSNIKDKKWFWDTEIVAIAYTNNLKIFLLPVLFIRKNNKKSTVKLVNDSLGYFVSLLKFRKKYFLGEKNVKKD